MIYNCLNLCNIVYGSAAKAADEKDYRVIKLTHDNSVCRAAPGFARVC